MMNLYLIYTHIILKIAIINKIHFKHYIIFQIIDIIKKMKIYKTFIFLNLNKKDKKIN